MAHLNMTMPASRINQDITAHVTVTGLGTWKARWWVALRLFYFAARVAGCDVHIDLQKR